MKKTKQKQNKKKDDINCLATKVVLNTKVEEAESKIPNITNLARKIVLNAYAIEIENKIPDIIGFSATPEFNRLKLKTL